MTKREKEHVFWIGCLAVLAVFLAALGFTFGRPAFLLLAFLYGLAIVVSLMCKGLLVWLNS